MLWSQHLVTSDTVEDFNNAVNQINRMQRSERASIESQFNQSNEMTTALRQSINQIQSRVNSLDYTLYRLEYLLARW